MLNKKENRKKGKNASSKFMKKRKEAIIRRLPNIKKAPAPLKDIQEAYYLSLLAIEKLLNEYEP